MCRLRRTSSGRYRVVTKSGSTKAMSKAKARRVQSAIYANMTKARKRRG